MTIVGVVPALFRVSESVSFENRGHTRNTDRIDQEEQACCRI
jgi:hypothetical protein